MLRLHGPLAIGGRLTGAVGLADRGDGDGAFLVPPVFAQAVEHRGTAGGRGCVRRTELHSQPPPRAERARRARVARALLKGQHGHFSCCFRVDYSAVR